MSLPFVYGVVRVRRVTLRLSKSDHHLAWGLWGVMPMSRAAEPLHRSVFASVSHAGSLSVRSVALCRLSMIG